MGAVLRRMAFVVGTVAVLSPAWVTLGWLVGWVWAALSVGVVAVYAALCPLGAPRFGVLPLLVVVPMVVCGLALASYALGAVFTPSHCDPYIDECVAVSGGDPYEIRNDQEELFWLARAFVLVVAGALIWGGARIVWSQFLRYRGPARPALVVDRAVRVRDAHRRRRALRTARRERAWRECEDDPDRTSW
ncbi:hypothetical protein DSC45_29525 [Streptomyces sp. YIM 130001]|uniref:hypothetical protein n=1 Tax=Streptomyces sp. YIM 130001 TaxID=2259644 RepID=UPI000E64F2C3|nr:hypothetical protein [Streptomyces sp. YIM 130001]RII09648.1 hypothetical protein DSC45_29525 [Streptomyces sp. YIM 130001]